MKYLSKRILAGALALLCLGLGSAAGMTARAAQPVGCVAVSVDANVLGAGVLYGPELVPFYPGESCADVTDRFLGGGNYTAHPTYSYVTGIKLPRDFEPDVPAVLSVALGAGHSRAGEFLQEFDFTATAGWFYTVNHEDAGVGAGSVPAQDGDVLRWQFSLIDWGADLGLAWDGNNVFTPEDKTALVLAVAQINSSADKAALLVFDAGVKAAYDAAYTVLADLAASQSDISGALEALNSAVANAVDHPPGTLLEKWYLKLPSWLEGIAACRPVFQYVILFAFFGWIWFLF